MKLRVYSYLLLVDFLLLLPISAQQALPTAIDGQVDRLAADEMASLHEPSLAISMVNDGKLIFTKGYGVSDVENNVPATADTVYRIASVSKSLTATAAMRLVEEHRLDLDAPVQKYCPAFGTKQWPITVREVLTHQSGIRHYKNDDESINTRHYTSINETLTQDFAKDPLLFERGTKFSYSSYGYIVLGCVMEGASGMSYTTYMGQSIFGPAGMTSSLRADWMMSSQSSRTVRVDTVSTRMADSKTQPCSTSATSHRVAVSTRLPAILACSWRRCIAAS